MEVKLSAHQKLINKEIREVKSEIASLRYDLTEAILTGVPLGLCHNITNELSRLLLKELALELGAYIVYGNYIRYTLKL